MAARNSDLDVPKWLEDNGFAAYKENCAGMQYVHVAMFTV
jgi:hypothetical protein